MLPCNLDTHSNTFVISNTCKYMKSLFVQILHNYVPPNLYYNIYLDTSMLVLVVSLNPFILLSYNHSYTASTQCQGTPAYTQPAGLYVCCSRERVIEREPCGCMILYRGIHWHIVCVCVVPRSRGSWRLTPRTKHEYSYKS